MSELFEHLQRELDEQDPQEAFSASDLLSLPPTLANVIQTIMRAGGMKRDEIAQEFELSPEETEILLSTLVQKGFFQQVPSNQEMVYKPNFQRKPRKTRPNRKSPIAWDKIFEQKDEK